MVLWVEGVFARWVELVHFVLQAPVRVRVHEKTVYDVTKGRCGRVRARDDSQRRVGENDRLWRRLFFRAVFVTLQQDEILRNT